jgi:sRNA-binding regulator protein Hfq
VYGADITGPLDLPFVNIPFQLRLNNCRLNQDINLSRAELSELDLQGSLMHGITADGVIVKSGVFLRNGFAASGEVRLLRAQIGRDLACTGGTFRNKGGDALNADGINVKGSVFLSNGFTANGEVRLVAAQIGCVLGCEGGTFTNEGGHALNADGINVKGSVFLNLGKNAEGKQTPFSAKGAVNLNGAQIDGQLSCIGGVFSNPDGDALSANRSVVTSSVFLREGFTAEGGVYLEGAQIGGTLDCRDGNFQKATLDLTDASAGRLYDSGLNDIAPGLPAGSPPTKWPQAGKLLLDGFAYGRISSNGRINAKRRIKDWLESQPQSPFHPKPYLQLAKILRESGDNKGSKRVLIKMEDRLRKGDTFGLVMRPLLRWTVGYGYRPLRILWWAALLTLVGWFIYQRNYLAGGMVPTDKEACAEFTKQQEAKPPAHYPGFSPLIYSVENSLPLVKLGQGDKWQPDPDPDPKKNQSVPRFLNCFVPSPLFVTWFLRIQILLGWLLATLFIAGVSGIVHKE